MSDDTTINDFFEMISTMARGRADGAPPLSGMFKPMSAERIKEMEAVYAPLVQIESHVPDDRLRVSEIRALIAEVQAHRLALSCRKANHWGEHCDNYDMTVGEARLFHRLVRDAGNVVSPAALFSAATNGKAYGDLKLVGVMIFRIRPKIGLHGMYIDSVRGAGYRLMNYPAQKLPESVS